MRKFRCTRCGMTIRILEGTMFVRFRRFFMKLPLLGCPFCFPVYHEYTLKAIK